MKALVTGGTGFLGHHLVQRLRAEGGDVAFVGRNAAVGEALQSSSGARFVRADLADAAAVAHACEGREVVFHCGGLSSPWGRWPAFERANVSGTRNVAEACRRHRVARLVHVSTPSLYFDYRHRAGIREDQALPSRQVNAYARSKRLAEDLVRGSGLWTIIIRPRAIFGPGDTSLLPRLLRACERGVLPLIGEGRALADVTCVENVVDALLLCAHAPQSCGGRIYNVTNGDPRPLARLLGDLCQRLGLRVRPRAIPYLAALGTAAVMEAVGTLLGWEPPLTRYSVGVLAFTQTLDISAIRRDLGYVPRVSIDDGMEAFAREWEQRPR